MRTVRPPSRVPLALLILSLCLGGAPARAAFPAPTREERSFDMELDRLSRALSYTDAVNPDGPCARDERARFEAARRAGRVYEPQLRYGRLCARTRRLAHRIALLPAPGGAYGPLLAAVRNELLLKFRILETLGTQDFPSAAAALHPPPDDALVAAARRLLAEGNFADPPSAPLSAPQVRDRLAAALPAYRLAGWRVELADGMAARAAVQAVARRVKVNRSAVFAGADVERLARHELGVHAVRGARGERMPLRIFRSGLAGYLDTEEGLAAHAEAEAGIRSGLRLFALRALAVDLAGRAGFSAVHDLLLAEGATPEEAWTIALRAKRGMGDTARPGAFPKDAAYLRGLLAVRAFVSAGGDIGELVRYGKIGLADLARVQALSAAVPGRFGAAGKRPGRAQ